MNENLPQRKSIRLKNYDYTQNGYYFITICTQNHRRILSEVCRGGVLLRPQGIIIKNELEALEKRYNIEISPYVIMPNHIHMIIKINRVEQWEINIRGKRAEQSPAPTAVTPSIPDIVCAFKSLTTKEINKNDGCLGRKLWQRNYYEHIIRNERDYLQTAEYIQNNPINWEADEYHE